MKAYFNKKILLLVMILALSLFISIFCLPDKNKLDIYPSMTIVENKPAINSPTPPPEIFPVALHQPGGNLKIPLVPFVYNSISKIENTRDPNYAIAVLNRFQYLVCAEPGHLDQEELQVSDAIKTTVKIFGYVNMGGKPLNSLSKIKKEIDNISSNRWYGVFIDQFGYDFGETRKRQNSIVEYAHQKGLKCFINSWFIYDVFGNSVDSLHNPKGVSTVLSKDDFYLMESFYLNNSGYIQDKLLFLQKCRKAQDYRYKFGVKIISLSYKRDGTTWEESRADMENSYITTLLMGFDGWWFTDKLEDDSFVHGNQLNLDFGNSLVTPISELKNGFLMSKTDKYIFLLDTNKYPLLNFEAFSLNSQGGLDNYIENHGGKN